MIKLQKARLIFLIFLVVIVITSFSMTVNAYVCTDGDSPPGCFCLNACSFNSYAPIELGELTCCSGVGTGGGVCPFYCADITDGSHYCFGGGDCCWTPGYTGNPSVPITFYRDNDRDGYSTAETQTFCYIGPNAVSDISSDEGYIQTRSNPIDCNDNNFNINPGVAEFGVVRCTDNINNDCDTYADCRDSGCTGVTYPSDCDQDGYCAGAYRTCLASGLWSACSKVPGTEVCDSLNVDENCDGVSNNLPSQSQTVNCGVGACYRSVTQTRSCTSTGWSSWSPACVPGTPVPEVCGNGVDEDCSGADAVCGVCVEGSTQPCTRVNIYGTCSGVETCSGGAWVSCTATVPALDVCGNGVDEDCDGVDASCGCVPVPEVCGNGVDDDCDGDADMADNDCWTPEVCDGVDNDGDGSVDEGLTTTDGCDQDGYCSGAFKTCTGGTWGSCSKVPGTEVCSGGVDEDCDGLVDCSDLPFCLGRLAEVCGNGLDDDCDGFVDSFDSDCCVGFDSSRRFFELRGGSGSVLARVDQDGVLWLRGVLRSWVAPSGSGNFVVQDSSGSAVLWISGVSGDLYLRGSVSVFSGGGPSGSGNFVVQDSSGGSVLWVSSGGGLFLRDCIGYGKTFT